MFLKLQTRKRITQTRVFVIPKDVLTDLRRDGAVQASVMADFDEQVTSSIRGPFLIEVEDVDEQIAGRLRSDGVREETGYKVRIPDNSPGLEEIRGDYCAFYRREKILTLDRKTARSIVLLLHNVPPWRALPTEEGGTVLERAGTFFVERFPAAELRLAFPILLLFTLISAAATLTAVSFFRSSDLAAILFGWSFIPLLFYSGLLLLSLQRTGQFIEFFSLPAPSGVSSNELRKRRYTQIILIVLILLSSFGFFDTFSWWLQQNLWAPDGLRLAIYAATAFVLFSALLFIHKRFPTPSVRAVLVLLILVAFAFIDSTEQTIQGRSLVFQIMPILLAGFLLTPASGLLAVALTTAILTGRSLLAGLGINSTAYLGLAAVAFLTWLIAGGLENALEEVELTNRRLEDKVAERTRQLAKANKFKSEFLSQVSHELQSPIVAFSLFLKKITPLVNDDEHRALEHETRRVLEMSKAISSVAKIELDLLEQNQKLYLINLVPAIRKTMKIVEYQAHEAGIELLLQVEENPIPILGNPEHVTRILHNILNNAVKYTPERGRVSIVAAREGNAGVIEVTDTGIGIPTDELPYIFDRFSRASNAGGRPGTGLGLSMVRDMMDAMDGTVDVRSTPGRGTTFTLRFPLATPQNDSPARAR